MSFMYHYAHCEEQYNWSGIFWILTVHLTGTGYLTGHLKWASHSFGIVDVTSLKTVDDSIRASSF